MNNHYMLSSNDYKSSYLLPHAAVETTLSNYVQFYCTHLSIIVQMSVIYSSVLIAIMAAQREDTIMNSGESWSPRHRRE